MSPALVGIFFTTEPPGKPLGSITNLKENKYKEIHTKADLNISTEHQRQREDTKSSQEKKDDYMQASLVAQTVKESAYNAEDPGSIPG